MSVVIREECPDDSAAIRLVNERAFGQPLEGQLIDALRKNGAVSLSLVAIADDRVVGHLLYSPVTIASGGNEVVGAGLAPLAVLPEFQRRGIGTQLVDAGNAMLRDRGIPFLVVLGHPTYYPRFGFVPASQHGMRCIWKVSDNVFMALVWDRERMKNVSGLVRYREEFSLFN